MKNELNKETLEEQLERVFLDLMRNKDIKAAMVQKAFRKFLYAPERRELQEELFMNWQSITDRRWIFLCNSNVRFRGGTFCRKRLYGSFRLPCYAGREWK